MLSFSVETSQSGQLWVKLFSKSCFASSVVRPFWFPAVGQGRDCTLEYCWSTTWFESLPFDYFLPFVTRALSGVQKPAGVASRWDASSLRFRFTEVWSCFQTICQNWKFLEITSVLTVERPLEEWRLCRTERVLFVLWWCAVPSQVRKPMAEVTSLLSLLTLMTEVFKSSLCVEMANCPSPARPHTNIDGIAV